MATHDEPIPDKRLSIERQQRIAYARDRLLREIPDNRVTEALIERFHVHYTTARVDVRAAWEEIAKLGNDKPAAWRKAQMRSMLWRTFRRWERTDGKTALRALETLCKVDGLFAPTKIQHMESQLTDEELSEQLRQLAADHLETMTDEQLERMLAARRELRESDPELQ